MISAGTLAIPTGKRQAQWNAASQERVSSVSQIIGNIKSLRISGLNERAFAMVERLRRRELDISKGFRIYLALIVVSCKLMY